MRPQNALYTYDTHWHFSCNDGTRNIAATALFYGWRLRCFFATEAASGYKTRESILFCATLKRLLQRDIAGPL